MTLKQVDFLPERGYNGGRSLDSFVKTFMNMDVKYAQVGFNDYEYTTESSCRGSLACYLRNNPDLPIRVHLVNSQVYLIRTDLEE